MSPRSSAARTSWGDDDSNATILHVDMDSFFASVELLARRDLIGKPVVVGGSSVRGVVTSATYEARAFGVRAGQPISQALAACPAATFLPSSHGLYKKYSQAVMGILHQTTLDVEQVSIDEAFLDVSGSTRRLGPPTQIARALRKRIRDEVGLPASVGIAHTKSVAKIASAHAKPDGVLLIPEDSTIEFLHSLPAGALWGVGKKTEQVLKQRGIDTVADLARTKPQDLARWVGNAGAARLLDLAWGKDPRAVAPKAREKSMTSEQTFEQNVSSPEELERFVLQAAHQCAKRLRAAGLVASTVGLKLRDARFQTLTRSRTLSAPTDVGREIAVCARGLLRSVAVPVGGVRLIGVSVQGLADPASGLEVPLDRDPRGRDIELGVDRVDSRYGPGAVLPASLLGRSGH